MAKTREEVAREASEAATKAGNEHRDAQREAALAAREEEPDAAETEEEYYARIQAAASTGIFGDTPTDPTTGDVQVPTSNEEAAGVAVAEKDVAVEEGDEDAAEVSDEEAKRQVDAAAGTTGFADEVDEAADEPDTENAADQAGTDDAPAA
jgi:hypothetical protein